ncbi:MAG: GNAT family N-acetyltransferase [Actinomycetota bacterium]|nr:GNAT family N-acetyltransferase [Actinomycetota bacterium]
MIRTARFEDLGSLRAIDELAVYQREGRAWVATDEDDRPVGYILARVVDSNAHIDQVSVHPNHARQGIGADLIETVVAWAKQHRLAAITLTTFSEVPWNAPYYQRLGFKRVADVEVTDGLRRIRDHEAAHGLAEWPRVTMRRPLTG